MIQKGDFGAAVRMLLGTILPGLLIGAFTRPDVLSQYLAIMSVTYVALVGYALTRRVRRASYYQKGSHVRASRTGSGAAH